MYMSYEKMFGEDGLSLEKNRILSVRGGMREYKLPYLLGQSRWKPALSSHRKK